jgi:hypothetical protein
MYKLAGVRTKFHRFCGVTYWARWRRSFIKYKNAHMKFTYTFLLKILPINAKYEHGSHSSRFSGTVSVLWVLKGEHMAQVQTMTHEYPSFIMVWRNVCTSRTAINQALRTRLKSGR